MNGIINFNKPKGMTSHDAVYYFRRLLKIKKVGHTGTLDPDATGVLPICIGKGTRVSEYILDADKEYIGVLRLGTETDTQDSSGQVLHTSSKKVNEDEIYVSFNKFKGDILQVPPMYSAIKHKGKRLYELAREGKVVERKPRPVKIYELNILEIKGNREITFYTRCSRGTYIRTLCNDIGRDLGTYGHMSGLTRVGVGSFKLEYSFSMEDLQDLSLDEIRDLIMPMDMALDKLIRIDVDKGYLAKIINGALVPVTVIDPKYGNNYRVYCDSKFIGIGRIISKEDKQFIKMDKVLV